MNYILESKKIDKIYETIFDVGFNFLHATLEEIKEYLDIYFDNDYEAFIKQELYVNYILILDDLRLSIKEQTKLDEEDDGDDAGPQTRDLAEDDPDARPENGAGHDGQLHRAEQAHDAADAGAVAASVPGQHAAVAGRVPAAQALNKRKRS